MAVQPGKGQANLEEQVESLNKIADERLRLIESLQAELSKKQEWNTYLESELQQKEGQFTSSLLEIESLVQRLSKEGEGEQPGTAAIVDLQQQLQGIQTQLEGVRCSGDDVSKLRKTTALLQDKVQDGEAQMEHLRRLEEEKTRQVFHIETDLTKSREENKRLLDELRVFKDENDLLRKQLAEASLKVSKLQEFAVVSERGRDAIARRAEQDREQFDRQLLAAKHTQASASHLVQRVSIRERSPSPAGIRGTDNTIELQRRVVSLANELQTLNAENKRLQVTVEQTTQENNAIRKGAAALEQEFNATVKALKMADERARVFDSERVETHQKMQHLESTVRQHVVSDAAKELSRHQEEWEKERFVLHRELDDLKRERARDREEFDRLLTRDRRERELQSREHFMHVLEESAVKLTNVEKQEALRWQEQLERARRTIQEKTERLRSLEMDVLRERERRIAIEEDAGAKMKKAKHDAEAIVGELQLQLTKEREKRLKSEHMYQEMIHSQGIDAEYKIRDYEEKLRREKDTKGKSEAEHVDRLERLAAERDTAISEARSLEVKLDRVIQEKIASLQQAEDSISALTDAITQERAFRLKLERELADKADQLGDVDHDKGRYQTQVKMLEEKIIQLLERQPLEASTRLHSASPLTSNAYQQQQHPPTEYLTSTHITTGSSPRGAGGGSGGSPKGAIAKVQVQLENSARERARKLMNYVHNERVTAEAKLSTQRGGTPSPPPTATIVGFNGTCDGLTTSTLPVGGGNAASNTFVVPNSANHPTSATATTLSTSYHLPSPSQPQGVSPASMGQHFPPFTTSQFDKGTWLSAAGNGRSRSPMSMSVTSSSGSIPSTVNYAGKPPLVNRTSSHTQHMYNLGQYSMSGIPMSRSLSATNVQNIGGLGFSMGADGKVHKGNEYLLGGTHHSSSSSGGGAHFTALPRSQSADCVSADFSNAVQEAERISQRLRARATPTSELLLKYGSNTTSKYSSSLVNSGPSTSTTNNNKGLPSTTIAGRTLPPPGVPPSSDSKAKEEQGREEEEELPDFTTMSSSDKKDFESAAAKIQSKWKAKHEGGHGVSSTNSIQPQQPSTTASNHTTTAVATECEELLDLPDFNKIAPQEKKEFESAAAKIQAKFRSKKGSPSNSPRAPTQPVATTGGGPSKDSTEEDELPNLETMSRAEKAEFEAAANKIQAKFRGIKLKKGPSTPSPKTSPRQLSPRTPGAEPEAF